jgi:hypothetical protein
MHRRNILIVSGAVLALNTIAAAVLFMWPVNHETIPLPENSDEVVTEPEEFAPGAHATTTETATESVAPTESMGEEVPPVYTTTEDTEGPSEVMLEGPQTTYTLDVMEMGTVLEVMDKAVAEGVFSYRGRTYPGIGVFVEEVGGLKNEKGMYWILYINGETSDRGVSSARVVPGDVITWNYEKSIF